MFRSLSLGLLVLILAVAVSASSGSEHRRKKSCGHHQDRRIRIASSGNNKRQNIGSLFPMLRNKCQNQTPSYVTSTNSQAAPSVDCNSDYKSQMASLISSIILISTPQGKNLLESLTNQLFGIYNTLNTLAANPSWGPKLRRTLSKQVDKFMDTLQCISNLIQAQSAGINLVVGNQNGVMGNNNLVNGDGNKIKGSGTSTLGNNNMVGGNQTVTAGSSNVYIGNNGFVVGNSNQAVGNDTYIFGSGQKVAQNDTLVVGNYSIDLNKVGNNNTKAPASSNSNKLGSGLFTFAGKSKK